MPHVSKGPGAGTQQQPRGNGALALTWDSDRTQAEEVEGEEIDHAWDGVQPGMELDRRIRS